MADRQQAGFYSIAQLMPIVGLGLFWASSFSFSDAAVLLTSLGVLRGNLYLSISVFALMVSSILIACVYWRFPRIFDASTGFVGTSTCIAGIGAFVLFASISRGGLLWLDVFGSVLMGFGAAVAMVAWGLYMSQLTSTESSLFIATGFFTGILLTALKTYLPYDAIIIYDITIYVFCGLIWQCAMKDASRSDWVLHSADWMKEVPWRSVAMFAVCALAGCTVEATGYANVSAMPNQNVYYVVLGAAILFAVVIWIAVLKRSNFGNLWPFFVLLLIACLMMLPVAGAMRAEQVLGWISAENWCLQALCWILLASIAYERRIPPVSLFGICFPLMISAPYCAGHAIARILSLPVENSGLLAAVMAFITVVAIVLALFDAEMFGGSRGEADSEEDSFREAVQRIGEQYGLSAREVDVAYLLARGYTLSRVGDELYISMNTVRTHTRKIYNKLNIHTKQELIDLIEQKGKEPPAPPAALADSSIVPDRQGGAGAKDS